MATCGLVPDDLLVSLPMDDNFLRQIVPCCTILLFLDEESLKELFEDGASFLDKSVVRQDYYLGYLICRSVLCAIVKNVGRYGRNTLTKVWRNDQTFIVHKKIEFKNDEPQCSY